LNGDRLAKPLIHVRQPLQIPHRRIYRRLRHLAARRTHSPHRTQSLRTLPRTHSRRLLNPARIRKLGIARRISNRTRPEYAVSHDTEIFSISFHPNGNQILTTSDDHTTKLWDIKGRLSHTFIGHNAGVWDASFSQDGKQLATAGKDNKVFLWNIQGKHLHTLEGHTAPVMRVRFSPNDRLIATASDDDTIKLWYSDGTAIATLKGHEDDVNSIHFNPSYPNILASVSLDNTLILWNIENLSLDGLLQQGCYWVRDYLKNNYRAPQNLCR